MDSCEFYRVMAPTIAAIKCGHTGVAMSPGLRAETEGLPWFPFEVKVLKSKAYIFRDYAKTGTLGRKGNSIDQRCPRRPHYLHDACRLYEGW